MTAAQVAGVYDVGVDVIDAPGRDANVQLITVFYMNESAT
jgi:hypothetical protein